MSLAILSHKNQFFSPAFFYHSAPTLGFSFVKEVFFAQKISVDPIHHLQRLLLFEQKGASFVQNRGFLLFFSAF